MGEVEGVHQMRVAVRRLRGDLRMFAGILDGAWTGDLKAELSWLADTLGAVRDADVLIARLRQESQDLGQALKPLFQELEESHTRAAQALEAGLADERYTALLDRLIEASREPHFTEAAIEPCHYLLPRLVDKVWRRLASGARALTPASPDEDLHAVRILAKRVRYASEMAAKCLAPNTARNAARFAGGAEEIQNILGDHQDTVIARAKLVDVASRASEQPPYAFALGQLAERQASAALVYRERFFDSWKSFDKKGIRSWLSRRGRR
jgi:CHAD domain-containing protein